MATASATIPIGAVVQVHVKIVITSNEDLELLVRTIRAVQFVTGTEVTFKTKPEKDQTGG